MNHYAAICFAAIAVLYASGASAFCVYNKTNSLNFCVVQTAGNNIVGAGDYTLDRGATKWLAPGDKLCCNWQEKTCNTGGKRTDNVSFRIGVHCASGGHQLSLCRAVDVTIQAGGWIDVTTDADGHVRCTGYQP